MPELKPEAEQMASEARMLKRPRAAQAEGA